MFCPEGFVTLNEICFWFSWDTDLVGSAMDRPDLIQEGRRFVIDTGIDEHEVRALQNWLNLAFLRNFASHLRVCTPTGSILKVDYPLWSFRRDDLWVNYNDYDAGFPFGYAERLSIAEWDFTVLDIAHGRIKPELPSGCGALSLLAGFPVCIRSEHLPTSLSGITRWLLDNGYPSDSAAEEDGDVSMADAPKPTGGRPSYHAAIVEEFKQAFPHGFGGIPLTEVADRLCYDRKTVRTALTNAGLYRPRSGQKPGRNPQSE